MLERNDPGRLANAGTHVGAAGAGVTACGPPRTFVSLGDELSCRLVAHRDDWYSVTNLDIVSYFILIDILRDQEYR